MGRQLSSLLGNSQRLDGGAMFGNAPKAMWSQWTEVDDQNRIPLHCRALLVQEDDRTILLEAGVGAFFEPKLKERFGIVESEHILLKSLEEHDLSHEDIDVVILSHLHFDHAGGLLSTWEENKKPELLFPNAQFIVGKTAWERAQQPHPRDRASFLPELNQQLEASNRLIIVAENHCDLLGEDYFFHQSHGHTPGMLLTEIAMPDGPIIFMADLIPGCPWVHAPISMGYDRYPEQVINEKKEILAHAVEREARFFYTHDSEYALSGVIKNEKGRYIAVDKVRDFVQLEQ